jgi:hypothetical protein
MTEDMRLVVAGAALLLSSSALFLRTGVSGDVSLLLATIAIAGIAVAALRFGARRTV